MLQQILQAETPNKSGHSHILHSPVPDTTLVPVPESDLTISIDYILGSDCLYTTEDFESVISLVAAIMTDSRGNSKGGSRGDRNTVFYTTYYQRRYVHIVYSVCIVSMCVVSTYCILR